MLRCLAGAVLLGAAACQTETPPHLAQVVAGGDATRGAAALREFGCQACHAIPGIRGEPAYVGPPLTKFARRSYVAGALPNRPENLVRWIQNPQAIQPGTVMPNLGVSEAQARDIAAYLYTLR